MPSDITKAQALIDALIGACDQRMARTPDHVPQLRKEQIRYRGIQASLHLTQDPAEAAKLAVKVIAELAPRLPQLLGPVTW